MISAAMMTSGKRGMNSGTISRERTTMATTVASLTSVLAKIVPSTQPMVGGAPRGRLPAAPDALAAPVLRGRVGHRLRERPAVAGVVVERGLALAVLVRR